MTERVHFSGPITVQFTAFLQGLMETDPAGNQVFVGVVKGIFGVPPNGKGFDAQVKLSVGASFTDDAYEVIVYPALADLGAKPEFQKAAFQYVDGCMRSMVGPHWARMTGLTAQSNMFYVQSPMVVINFPDSNTAW